MKPNKPKINPKFNFKKEKNVDSDDETLKQRFDDYLQSDDSSNSNSSSEEDFEGDQSPENEDSTSDTSRKSKGAKKPHLDTALVFIAYSKLKSQQDFNEEQYQVTGEKSHSKRFQKSQISLQSLATLLLK